MGKKYIFEWEEIKNCETCPFEMDPDPLPCYCGYDRTINIELHARPSNCPLIDLEGYEDKLIEKIDYKRLKNLYTLNDC
jgi:hypothetical protein